VLADGAAAAVSYFVYLLLCADGTYYAGIARDVARRLAAHNAGRGAKYVRGRTPAVLITARGPMAHGDALGLEAAVKRARKGDKQARLESAETAPPRRRIHRGAGG
jgi:putative endonuclease